jgi:hypothetical protein
MDGGIVRAGTGLLTALTKIAKWFSSRRKREVSGLQELADRKFAELEVFHSQFVDRVLQLKLCAMQALEKLGVTKNRKSIITELKAGIDEVLNVRMKERDLRRERYEEAKAFETVRFEQAGLVKTIPDEVVTALDAFLRAYSGYFEMDRGYRHALARFHDKIRSDVSILELSQMPLARSNSELFRETLSRATTEADRAEVDLRQRWQQVARSYHLLNAVLLKHGFARVLKSDKKSPQERTRKKLTRSP